MQKGKYLAATTCLEYHPYIERTKLLRERASEAFIKLHLTLVSPGKTRAQVTILFGGGVPIISSVSPPSGSVLGGARMTILGEGFQTIAARNTVVFKRIPPQELDCRLWEPLAVKTYFQLYVCKMCSLYIHAHLNVFV